MYARVTRWEGAQGDGLRRSAAEIEGSPEPPPGVPAKGFTMLIDEESGRSLAIALFETEEDLRKGDETLNSMSPPSGEEMGKRTGVEMYEVAFDTRL